MILRGGNLNLFHDRSKFRQQLVRATFNLHLIVILQNNHKNVNKAESYWFSLTNWKHVEIT